MPDSNTELLLEGKKPALKRKPVACAEGWEKREMGGRSVFVCAPPPPKAVGGGCKAVETPPLTSKHAEEMGSRSSVSTPAGGGGHGSRLCERPHGVQEAGDVPGLRGEGSLAQLSQVAALRPLGGARQPQRSPQPPVTGPAADHAGDSRGTGGEAEGEKPSASPVRAAPA